MFRRNEESERTSLLQKEDKVEQKISFSIDRNQLLWLLKLAKQEWLLVIIGSFFLLTGSVTSLVLPNLVGRLIDLILSTSQGKVNF